MNVLFEKRFSKDLKAVQKDAALLHQVQQVIDHVKSVGSVSDIKNLKKMTGYAHFYRIRIGEYRLGLSIQENQVIFVRCLHRREMYRYFP